MLKYKDSGIEWIGEIPRHWNTSKVKYLFSVINGSTPDTNNTEYWGEDIEWITPADMNNIGEIYSGSRKISLFGKISSGLSILPIGSIVISNRAPIGKINYTMTNLCTNQGCKGLVRNANNRYFYYLFISSVERLLLLGRGTTFLELSTNDLNNLELIVPTLDEQKQVADFLDKKCEEIDDITSKIEKQIELLKDYKNSLITETVTKGLDKNVPMKDSGLEWIGKIPKDWKISRIKYSLSLYAGGDIDYSNFSDTKDKVYRYPVLSNSLENQSVIGYTSKYRFYGETVTITGRGLVGVAFPRNEEFYPVVRLLVGIPSIDTNNRYMAYWINSVDILGEQTAMSQLTTDKLGRVEFVKPCLIEQIKIADFLDRKCKEIDSIISKKEKQLELIKEHRKSLIYEYVTGKKCVRGVMDGN